MSFLSHEWGDKFVRPYGWQRLAIKRMRVNTYIVVPRC